MLSKDDLLVTSYSKSRAARKVERGLKVALQCQECEDIDQMLKKTFKLKSYNLKFVLVWLICHD